MTSFDIKRANELNKAGATLGREGLSVAVISAVSEFDGSHKGAMNLAGRLKAIAQAAKADGYWSEKVEDGFQKQFFLLTEGGAFVSEKLKPCPFCGSHKIKDDVYMRDGRRVVCRECSASVGAFNPNANERAVALWNRRHQEQDQSSTFDRWVK